MQFCPEDVTNFIFINFFSTMLRQLVKYKTALSVPKLMWIGSVVLKMWAVKSSGPF